MYDNNIYEKEILHLLFFPPYAQNPNIIAPIAQCFQFPLQASVSSFNFASNPPQMLPFLEIKKKGKMTVECPHKDKKHYAKVIVLSEYVH
jgi:hypothetical protein